MEAVEFYTLNGKTYINRSGASKELTPDDREIIEFMMDNIEKIFPDAMAALRNWAFQSKPNKWYYEYRIVDRFIRCNFGEADFLSQDIEMDVFHFEEVKCPLRNICEHEGVICKPKARIGLTEEELKVVNLYAKGMLPGEISKQLGKKESTCKRHIYNAYKRLQLASPRNLIKVFRMYNIIV